MTRSRIAGALAGPLVAACVYWIPSGLHRIPGMEARPAAAAAVVLWMGIWWFTEVLPMGVTALLPLVLFPALGVFGEGLIANVRAAALPFADAYIFLFMGGMALGAGLEQWGLHRRVALLIMRAIGTAPERLLLGMLVATAAVSMWISNTATAVMMVPIGIALILQLEAAEKRRLPGFGAALMLAVAYAANVGGIGTKIGTAANSIYAGIVATRLGREVGFLEYMAVGAPFVALFVPIIWAVLWRIGRRDALGPGQGVDVIRNELALLGPLSPGEKIVGAVFLAAAGLWIAGDPLRGVLAPHASRLLDGARFQSKHYEALVAMGAALTLFLLGRLSLQALRKVPWDALLLLGGGFALAAGIEASGLSAWMSGHLRIIQDLPAAGQYAVAAGATVLLSAIASNTATVNVMLNILPGSLPVLTVTAMASSCDFALPAGTPPNAIVFGSGYVRLPTMMKAGLLLDVLATAALTLYGLAYVRYFVAR